jgi:methylated-DNA-protein-cysteine methyltransferase related protein
MSSSEMAEHVAALYRSIYAVVRRIPRGRVATYGQVAELAGIPGGARVAGAAMKTSKPGDRLPWQRVIGKSGTTRGRIAIQDPVGAAVQRQLLEDEGVAIGDTGLVALDRYGWLPAATSRRASARANAATGRAAAARKVTAGSARAASPRRQPRSGSKRRASSSRR